MRIVLSLAVCAVATLPAMATPAADALNAVTKCAEISSTPERLQCFDAAAVGAKQVLDDARKQAEAEQKPDSEGSLLSWFGFTPEEKPVTKPEDFGKNVSLEPKADQPPELTEIASKVVEFAQNAHGKSIFILDNGQVWRQIDGDTTEFYYREKDGPMQVTISRGMMGSFVLKAEGKSGSLKVRRVK
jgi:hypothetical protein